MKLIIECTELTYSECKKISGLSETAYVIAHGTPYNPSGDCISREALKEQINATDFDCGDYYDNTEIIRERVCNAIDNAQAIPLPNEQIAWEQGYEAGLAQGKQDNAPSVEPIKQCKDCKHCGNEDYCSNCHSDHSLFEYYERPQGEWINREAVSNTFFPFWERYECNQCHKFSGYSNFCPNCGADMRKGGAE